MWSNPKTAIQTAVDFMPSFYRQTSPVWTLQSMALDPTKRNYEIRLSEDTTKAHFLVTVSNRGDVTKAQKLP
jgi:tricorn protease-like protein